MLVNLEVETHSRYVRTLLTLRADGKAAYRLTLAGQLLTCA